MSGGGISAGSYAALASVAPLKSAWVRISAPRALLSPNKDANAGISLKRGSFSVHDGAPGVQRHQAARVSRVQL